MQWNTSQAGWFLLNNNCAVFSHYLFNTSLNNVQKAKLRFFNDDYSTDCIQKFCNSNRHSLHIFVIFD